MMKVVFVTVIADFVGSLASEESDAESLLVELVSEDVSAASLGLQTAGVDSLLDEEFSEDADVAAGSFVAALDELSILFVAETLIWLIEDCKLFDGASSESDSDSDSDSDSELEDPLEIADLSLFFA